ncbi:MAG: hypothetical protein GVY02_04285 [Bacteroidetes bacterium]|jgi:NOL1/NOP2/fmu family ribosome biogenesis protein|nr:hypothetical protein [Bacteroidota bacterium]
MKHFITRSRILITLIILVTVSISCGGGSGTTYSIEVSPTPQEGGSVSPAEGEYEEGARVEVSADPNEEWIFSSWQGDVQGTENPVVVTVDGDKVFTALFEKKTYPLNITIDGEGTVDETVIQTKNKDYEVGTTVELSANPAEGWEFVRWEGDLESSSNPEQITVNKEASVTAVFERSGFELEITVDGEGSVTENVVEKREKVYEEGSVVELTAEPGQGWRFVRWEGDLDGSENPVQITVDEDKEVTAIFERRDYALNINTEGEGSVGEEVIQSPKKDYAYETVVELTASAAEGWKFERWEGDLSGSENPEQITISEEKTVTAVFSRVEYTLDVSVQGEGTVSEEVSQNPNKDYAYETVVELTANPDEGWAFVRWEGDLSGSENPEEITMNSDKSVTAVFEEIVAYDLNISIDGEGSVSEEVLSSPGKSYEEGTVVELTADAADGWEFARWEGDLSGSANPEQITVDSEKNVTAVFEEIAEYPLNITIQGDGSVDESVVSNPNKSYREGTVVELTAQAADGWAFVRWEGDLSGSSNPEQVTMDSEKNVTAVFEEILYELDLNTEGEGRIIVEPSKDFYNYGDEIEVRASPNELWTFLRWEDDLSGDENPQTITLTSDLTITAVFGGVPKVRTADVFDMRVSSAMSGGEVTDADGQEISERGICWSRNDDKPNLADDCVSAGNGLGSFEAEMTGLGLFQGRLRFARICKRNDPRQQQPV